jgi:hypothetical protein
MTPRLRCGFGLCICAAMLTLIAGAAQLSRGAATGRHAESTRQTEGAKNETSLQAFRAVASVLTSPRCINCHVPGDGPLQGDDNHAHPMNVKRGADGKGTAALRCFACHQAENSKILHGPPGAADWQLPSPKTPMAWRGLSTGELCRTLKDPAKNGNRSLQDLIPHMETSLVRWAWNPGLGRTVPPLSRDEFVSRLKEWIETGAACPE